MPVPHVLLADAPAIVPSASDHVRSWARQDVPRWRCSAWCWPPRSPCSWSPSVTDPRGTVQAHSPRAPAGPAPRSRDLRSQVRRPCAGPVTEPRPSPDGTEEPSPEHVPHCPWRVRPTRSRAHSASRSTCARAGPPATPPAPRRPRAAGDRAPARPPGGGSRAGGVGRARHPGRDRGGGPGPGGHGGVARRPGRRSLDGRPVTETVAWVPELGVDLDLRLDGFARADGRCSCRASACSCSPTPAATSRRRRRAGAAASGCWRCSPGSMLGLVLADNLLVLYGFWELTSVTSFLLIGNDSDRGKARAAALQALLVTGAGGLAMLGGLRADRPGDGRHVPDQRDPRRPARAAPGHGRRWCSCSLGAFTKSAQYPFHVVAARAPWWRPPRSAPTCTRPRW